MNQINHFWLNTPLEKMTDAQWESLCDGCGKCCLAKLIDDDTEELHYTNVACDLLDNKKCGCSNYANRFALVPDCVKVSIKDKESFAWLPTSCAYKRLAEGKTLPSWHPLLTGSKSAMHKAGMSIRGKIVYESQVDYLENYIALWPLNDCE